ncbi:MAG: MFS transporter [Chloroflexi bacterium]|nr:MFS transporter [Chloroflexota bacterium]
MAADAPTTAAAAARIHPERTLTLLSIAHAVNHAQAVILPLLFLKVIDEFHVPVAAIAFVSAAGAISSGLVQATFAFVTRRVSRRWLMAVGGVLFGVGFAAQAAAAGFGQFALLNVASRIGGSPQHPVGNGLLAEQFPPERRGFAISAHISGGNVGTVIVALFGPALLAGIGWRGVSILFGIPAAVIALAILRWVRESGADRAAAIAAGSVRDAVGTTLRDPTIRRIYLASVLGGGGRGLGVANLFTLLYLSHVLALPDATTYLMYGVLIVLSVPMPLVAGWLSDRIGRRPVVVGAYVGGAVGFLAFLAAGSSLVGLWVGLAIMGLFSFAESPQLQALLADVVPTPLRDVTFALYFTLAFGVGSLWTAFYGTVIDAMGEASGLPVVFVLMAVSFMAAAVTMWPVRDDAVVGHIEVEPVETV